MELGIIVNVVDLDTVGILSLGRVYGSVTVTFPPAGASAAGASAAGASAAGAEPPPQAHRAKTMVRARSSAKIFFIVFLLTKILFRKALPPFLRMDGV